jgi:deoxyribodipyrimidine photo-lyase
MQAGVTGINTIRIYNPVKQGTDHDQAGVFVKKWIPALQNVPATFIPNPWKLTLMEQQQAKCILGEDYPMPVVNLEVAAKFARENLWGLKNSRQVRENNKEVLGALSGRKHEDEAGA